MDILGIGPMELILVLIVALAVFGPEKLPTIGAKMGKAMRDMRRATRSFSEEIGAPAREIMEPIKEMSGAVKSIGEAASVARNPGEAIRQSVVKELKGATEPPAEPSEPENRIAPPGLTEQGAVTAEVPAAGIAVADAPVPTPAPAPQEDVLAPLPAEPQAEPNALPAVLKLDLPEAPPTPDDESATIDPDAKG